MIRPARPAALDNIIHEVFDKITDPKLKRMAASCLLNTWETTTFLMNDQTTFILTGDIHAMWLRDSACQVEPYLRFAAKDPLIKEVLFGLAERQAHYLCIDIYANAFNAEPSGIEQFPDDLTAKNPWVFERKYELDSLCHPIRLWWALWRNTGDRNLFSATIYQALLKIVQTMQIEQNHEMSAYYFQRLNGPPTDTLQNHGFGAPIARTGMVWSGFRPSDDACQFHYLIPAQLFAAQGLLYIAAIAENIYHDDDLFHKAQQLRGEILSGVETYGKVNHPKYGEIYAYEVDGLGGVNLMDDPNIPSLLSLPYLGVCPPDDPVYLNTRRFILSPDNPYYATGKYAKGLSSPHTPSRHIWPMALIMQGITTLDPEEADQLLRMVITTDADTELIHESFNPDNPAEYSRPWFAWANSLFSEWIMRCSGYRQYDPLSDGSLNLNSASN